MMFQGKMRAGTRAGGLIANAAASCFALSTCLTLAPAVAAPGDPDPAFGAGGKVVLTRGGSGVGTQQPLRQADGKWVVPYEANGLNGQRNGQAGGVVRLNADGTVDGTFGYEGSAGTGRSTSVVFSGTEMLVAGQSADPNYDYDYVWVAKLASNGALVPSFGTAGRTAAVKISPATSGYAYQLLDGIAVAPDGGIIVAGQVANATNNGNLIAVAKFTSAGVLDTTFGTAGSITFNPFGSNSNFQMQRLVVLADGSIAISGTNGEPGTTSFVAKVTAAGAVDTSFATAGIFTISNSSQCPGLVVDGTGFLVACSVNDDFNVFRLTSSGALDGTFSTTVVDMGTEDVPVNIQRLPSNKILVTGSGNNKFAVALLNANGGLDTSFNTTGYYVAPEANFGRAERAEWNGSSLDVLGLQAISGSGVEFTVSNLSISGARTSFSSVNAVRQSSFFRVKALPTGKVLAGGTMHTFVDPDNGTRDQPLFMRFNADGSLDSGFGVSGEVTASFAPNMVYGAGMRDFAVLSSGEIVFTGDFSSVVAGNVGLGKLLSSGAVDTSFNSAGPNPGQTVKQIGAPFTRNLRIQSDGKVIVTGQSATPAPSQLAVVRFNADGTVDSTYGTTGLARTTFANTSNPRYVELDAAGNAVVAGQGGGQLRFARFTPSGALDATFGTGGMVSVALPVGYNLQLPNKIVVLPDGKLLTVFTTNTSGVGAIGLLRLTSSGAVDTTFGSSGFSMLTITSYTLSNTNAFDMAIAPNGRILVAVQNVADANTKVRTSVARFNPNGELDLSFGGAGVRHYSSAGEGLNFVGLDVFADGALAMSGSTGDQNIVKLAVMKTVADPTAVLEPTTVALSSSANPSVLGQSVTLTALLTGLSTPPTGTVSFTSNGVPISGCASVTVTSSQALCTTSGLPSGSLSIVANYSGDSTHLNASSSVLFQQVNAAVSTTTSLVSSLNPSQFGQSVTFTATVTAASGTPAGTVSFTENGTPIASCTSVALTGTQAQCTTSSLSVGSRSIVASYSGNPSFLASTSNTVNQAVQPPASGASKRFDLNGDGKADVVWRNGATGQNWFWGMTGTSITNQGPITALPSDWQIQSTAMDFDGDGKSDILLRNMTTGQPWLWLMNGNIILGGGPLPTLSDLNWIIAGTGDLNGDGKGDIVWRNTQTGQNWYWGMNGTAIIAQGPITALPSDWQIQSVLGDFNGDGKSDILWRNMTTGQPWVWIMDGNNVINNGPLPTLSDLNWTIAGTGDLNGDGRADIVWRNTSTGQNWWWGMNGQSITAQGPITALPSVWQFESIGADYDGDGKADILLRNTSTGQPWIWFMNANNITGGGPLPTLSDLNWQIKNKK